MKRSLFTKSLLCGTFGLVGCRSDGESNAAGSITGRGALQFYRLPHWAEFLPSILPKKVFRNIARPAPSVHSPRFSPKAADEGNRSWAQRFDAERREYASRMRDAQDYFDSWNLHTDHYELLERLHGILGEQEWADWKIVYDSVGSLGGIRSLDLTGLRRGLSTQSFVDPDDPLSVSPIPKVSSECIDELMKVHSIRRLFLNYAECSFPKYLELVQQRQDFEVLGPPRGLGPDQLKEVIGDRSIEVLDLSGYELSNARDQLVDVAIRRNVRWLMFSNTTPFSISWIRADWEKASCAFRGVIGLGLIGVVDYPDPRNENAQQAVPPNGP